MSGAIYIPNGSGLLTSEGFSVPDGSGYVLSRSNYGCQNVFPGYFLHRYSGASPGADLGAAWSQQQASTHGMNSSGLDITNVNARDIGEVICPSLPTMTHCRMQANWVSSLWAAGVDGSGPAGYIMPNSLGSYNGYAVRVFNFNGDITVTNRVVLYRILASTDTTIAVAHMPDGPAFGPLNTHTYFLELDIVSSTHADDVSLKVYVDSVLSAPLINFTDTTSSRISPTNTTDPITHADLWPLRKPGMVGGANTVWTRYMVTDLD